MARLASSEYRMIGTVMGLIAGPITVGALKTSSTPREVVGAVVAATLVAISAAAWIQAFKVLKRSSDSYDHI